MKKPRKKQRANQTERPGATLCRIVGLILFLCSLSYQREASGQRRERGSSTVRLETPFKTPLRCSLVIPLIARRVPLRVKKLESRTIVDRRIFYGSKTIEEVQPHQMKLFASLLRDRNSKQTKIRAVNPVLSVVSQQIVFSYLVFC